jgi:hypothetical protein
MRDDGTTQNANIEVNTADDPDVRNDPTKRLMHAELSTRGLEYMFKLYVTNREGTASSPTISYLFATEPETPSVAPTIIEYSSYDCYVSYYFNDGIQGSEIISFNLQFRDTIDNRWIDLIGDDSLHSLATLHRFDVVKGIYYEVRHRVKNMIGWSEFSPVSSFKAADVPSEPQAPILLSFSSTQISLEFNQMTIDDGGLPLSGYVLELSDSLDNPYT